MPITSLITGQQVTIASDAGSREANRFFESYLRDNVEKAETLRSMGDVIREFRARAPRVKVTKCIDGRVHGPKSKGYPQGCISFSRTEGNQIDLSLSNIQFWNRVDRVVLDAKRHTPGMPALFIALGHRSGHGHGCAAHGLDDAKALTAVKSQAEGVAKIYAPEELVVLYGMTNTDDMSERLVFPDGTELDTEVIIAELDRSQAPLREPSDVFRKEFLDNQIDDEATRRSVRNLTPREMLRGPQAPMYRDFQTALAMEAYLLREIIRIERHRGKDNRLLEPRIVDAVMGILDRVRGLPESLKGALLYQSVWNVAYALYQRRRLETMTPEEQELHQDHAEVLACYGEGFETLPRNQCVLVKTGRGNDEDALLVARKVLLSNRERYRAQGRPQAHPPLVHINVEVSGELSEWDAFNDQVLSRINTMLRPIRRVFGEDVRVLTTYSYKNQKRFYPVRVTPDVFAERHGHSAEECFPMDVMRDLIDQSFTKAELERRENVYTQYMLAERP